MPSTRQGIVRAYYGPIPAIIRPDAILGAPWVWNYTVPADADYAVVRRLSMYTEAALSTSGIWVGTSRKMADETGANDASLYGSTTTRRATDLELVTVLKPGQSYRGFVTAAPSQAGTQTGGLSAYIEQIGGTVPGIVAEDTFTGTAGTNLGTHTTDGGQTWTVTAGAWSLNGSGKVTATSTTQSNQARLSGSYGPNLRVEADITIQTDITATLHVNTLNGTNVYVAGINMTTTGHIGQPMIQTIIGGVMTTVYGTHATAVAGTTYRVAVQVIAGVVTLYIDGDLCAVAYPSTVLDAGFVEIQAGKVNAGDTAVTFDNLMVRTL